MTFTTNKLQVGRRLLVAATLVSGFVLAPNSYARHNNNDSNCVNYRLNSTGEAGVRTVRSSPDDFTRSYNGRANGRFCTSGRINIELSKRNVDTQVDLEVDGQRYVFRRGDRGDRLTNTWYRRYITIDLRRPQQYDSDYYDNHNRYNHNDRYKHSDDHYDYDDRYDRKNRYDRNGWRR